MSRADPRPYHAVLTNYRQQAEALFNALKAHDEAAEWGINVVAPALR